MSHNTPTTLLWACHAWRDVDKLHRSHTYVFEGLPQLCELVEALLHDVGCPLVHLVVLVCHSTQHTLHRLEGVRKESAWENSCLFEDLLVPSGISLKFVNRKNSITSWIICLTSSTTKVVWGESQRTQHEWYESKDMYTITGS